MELVPTPATTVRPVADGVLDGAQQLAVLGHRGGRRLAGRAGDHDTVVAVVDEVGGDPRRAVEVDRAVVVERARHRGQHPTERGSGRRGARGGDMLSGYRRRRL